MMRWLLACGASALVFAPRPRVSVRRRSMEPAADEEFVEAAPLSTRTVDFLELLRTPDEPDFLDAERSRANRSVDYFGESRWSDLEAPADCAPADLEETLRSLRSTSSAPAAAESRVFCSRSLNLRGIKVIGYDMDYTIVHYKWREWELLAYECTKAVLARLGFPVDGLNFDDPDLACRGLVIDRERGNFLKIDRHGFVRRAMHGDRRLDAGEVDSLYGRFVIDLRDRRFSFINTLFSVSEGVLYAQLVQKLDDGSLARDAVPPFDLSLVGNYADLHRAVTKALSRAHGGASTPSGIKEAVVADPERYTQREPALLRRTLDDQRRAGKKLALITNSDWLYTDTMMTFVCDDRNWRSLFDVVVTAARKPAFFTTQKLPCYELVASGMGPAAGAPLLRETKRLAEGGAYCGGSARLIEGLFDVRENDVLYVGDHIFTDANAVKASMRWRTALVVQELAAEIAAFSAERDRGAAVDGLLARKDELSGHVNALRVALERWDDDRAATPPRVVDAETADAARGHVAVLLDATARIDGLLAPFLRDEGRSYNRHWGYLTRAGHNDKSHFHRQIEKYADVYCAKVTDLQAYTPYHYFRAAPQVLAHELETGAVEDVWVRGRRHRVQFEDELEVAELAVEAAADADRI